MIRTSEDKMVLLKNNFSRRVWLSQDGHSSTSSVVVFDGNTAWEHHDGSAVPGTFVEISDCHGKVRLHKGDIDSKEDFAKKIEILRDTLSDFARHLRGL